ncbi:MAG: ATP-binding protein [Acidimicrobiales bacterium]|nr:ATP-binding protein [Acidimicrobiales bacterium]MCB1250403.1 ATP-binding protein [Acidimicrobiales bacterium]
MEQHGAGRGARWTRRWATVHQVDLRPGFDEDVVWRQVVDGVAAAAGLSDPDRRTLRYAATELLNNACDHSQGSQVVVCIDPGEVFRLRIADDGIGAFPNVRRTFDLADDFAAIAWLDAGRQTTDPTRHSGQGLFFTSRAVSRFVVTSGTASWIVDNRVADRTVRSTGPVDGTIVDLELDPGRLPPLRSVFDAHTDPETLAFDRTTIHVRLAEVGREFVSRSEAKRIAAQIEAFTVAVIDFAGVASVGQGFVDELFRVLPGARPDLELVPINADEAVLFMVQRGLPRGGRG